MFACLCPLTCIVQNTIVDPYLVISCTGRVTFSTIPLIASSGLNNVNCTDLPSNLFNASKSFAPMPGMFFGLLPGRSIRSDTFTGIRAITSSGSGKAR